MGYTTNGNGICKKKLNNYNVIWMSMTTLQREQIFHGNFDEVLGNRWPKKPLISDATSQIDNLACAKINALHFSDIYN